jgi:predicted nucleotidyltransferase
MTLKEKFVKTYRKVFSVENLAEECEKIADEFAIEFAEWLNVNAYKYPTKTTTKELLEIYKKEKGL